MSDRLSDDGVFVLWMGQPFVDEALLRTLLATLRSVFPHVEAYDPRPGGSLLFLSARRPLRIAETAGRAISAAPGVWAEQGVLSPHDVVSARVQDEAGVLQVAEGARINTDGHNVLQTRSPRILLDKLGAIGVDRVFAPYDPLKPGVAGPEGAHLVQRFIDGRLPRARRVAGAMESGTPRRFVEALLEIASGRRARGEADLLRMARADRRARRAAGAHGVARGRALTRGEDPGGLLPRIAADPLGAAVLEGWRRSRSGQLPDVEELEPVLASAVRHEPLYEPALRLRLGWRLASGDPARAREAIALFDPFMAEAARAPDAVLRARLALAAGDAPAAYANLLEVADLGLVVSDDQQTAREALTLLDRIAAATGTPRARGAARAADQGQAGRFLTAASIGSTGSERGSPAGTGAPWASESMPASRSARASTIRSPLCQLASVASPKTPDGA